MARVKIFNLKIAHINIDMLYNLTFVLNIKNDLQNTNNI